MLRQVQRKELLAGAAGLGVIALLYARVIEPTRVQLDRFTVPVDVPGLPAAGLTILHLSDLHCRAGDVVQAAKLANLRRLLGGETYDLLLVTGDLIHDDAGIPAALGLLATLHPRLAAFSCPGNRDYWQSSLTALLVPPDGRRLDPMGYVRWTARQVGDFVRQAARNERWSLHVRPNDTATLHAKLAMQGIQPLVNQSAHVRGDGVDLWVAGVDDLTQGRPDLGKSLADVPDCSPLILLAHHPDAWLDPRARRAFLVLAGHTHGGQFRLPLVGALLTQGTHLTRSRPAGWFRWGSGRMFVSRGLGESFPFRFGAPPQAALVRLVPDELPISCGRHALREWQSLSGQ